MDFTKKLSNKTNLWILIGLGLLGALGILLLFLGCGLYHNWWPLLAICMFITVPIPIMLCSSETNRLLNDWSIFLAGFFAAISFGTFFLLAQYGNVNKNEPFLIPHSIFILNIDYMVSICI